MKIIFLNAWHGEMRDNLRAFIESHMGNTDMFCLSEAYNESPDKPWAILGEKYQKSEAHKQLADSDYSLANYVRRDIEVLGTRVLLQDYDDTGLGLVTRLRVNGRELNICSVHGAPHPGAKLDSPGRLKQSREIIDYFANTTEPIIIGGDFNLLPQTDSVKMFEKAGYRDLIKDYAIKTTRNHLCWDRFPDSKQLYADFTFVSPNIHVDNFSVPDNEVSDHLPQILEVTL